MNGNDCIEVIEKLCGTYKGRELTQLEEDLILTGHFYYNEYGGIEILYPQKVSDE